VARTSLYPDSSADRTRWILARRGPKNPLAPDRPYAAFVEEEIGPDGLPWSIATLLLTNRECAFRCLMCDLWQNTLDATSGPDALIAQLRDLPVARAVKLYNAGSFFDPGQVPESALPEIAARVRGYERVIVECHPAFLRGPHAQRVRAFGDAIAPAVLEVAIGLETAHPTVLERLNKRMTVDDFRAAARFLAQSGMALRVFLLLRPPFLTEDEGLLWAKRSLDLCQEVGATFAAVIPTRSGNGALDALMAAGEFAPPTLESLEAALRYGLSLDAAMRVTADLWDVERFVRVPDDRARIERIDRMNRTQRPHPPA
jgi:radical SAM enzyme (TIGR01210 family)